MLLESVLEVFSELIPVLAFQRRRESGRWETTCPGSTSGTRFRNRSSSSVGDGTVAHDSKGVFCGSGYEGHSRFMVFEFPEVEILTLLVVSTGRRSSIVPSCRLATSKMLVCWLFRSETMKSPKSSTAD